MCETPLETHYMLRDAEHRARLLAAAARSDLAASRGWRERLAGLAAKLMELAGQGATALAPTQRRT